MNIMFLIRSLEVGGAERQLASLARGLQEAGHDVSVVVFYPGGKLEADLEELLALAAKVSQAELRDTVARDARLGVLFRKLQSGELTDNQIRTMLNIMETEKNSASGNQQ